MFHHLKAITLRWNIIWSCREIMVLFFAKCGGPGISDSGPRLLLLLWMKNWISNWNVQEMYKTNAKRKNKKHSRAGATLGQGCFYCQSLDWVGQPTPFVSQLSTMLQKLRIWCHRKKWVFPCPHPDFTTYIFTTKRPWSQHLSEWDWEEPQLHWPM